MGASEVRLPTMNSNWPVASTLRRTATNSAALQRTRLALASGRVWKPRSPRASLCWLSSTRRIRVPSTPLLRAPRNGRLFAFLGLRLASRVGLCPIRAQRVRVALHLILEEVDGLPMM